jgi:sialidase-1
MPRIVIVGLMVLLGMLAMAAHSEEHSTEALDVFLGAPDFSMEHLWEGRGGTSIVAAQDGTMVAFQTYEQGAVRRSTDGGATWSADIEIGPNAAKGNAVVDERNGDILYVNPEKGLQWRSRDHGVTWAREPDVRFLPDGFGLLPGEDAVSGMQSGISLAFGPHKNRLLMPARIMGPTNTNDVAWRPLHYNTALYSDDGGAVWQTSKPFPVLGTGEAALAELSNGSILYNSREHMTRGNRFMAWSHDGGDLWLDAYRSSELPDGPRGSSYGCMGGMIRLPVPGLDVLLYSNLDTDAGAMPDRVGGSTGAGREKVTVWASFDGGVTWPLKRLVFDGPSLYSNLAAGRTATSSEGKVYMLFETGTENANFAIQVAVFNLSWLLNGRDISEFLVSP